jgi:inhibitor of cysteine peptidase
MPLSAADAGRTIRLGLHQQVSIQLNANPSTGYSWEILSAQNVRVDHPIDVVNPSAAPTSTVGAPGIAIVKVQPVRVGRGLLILGYKRPWEEAVEKKIRYSFRITR